MVLGSVPVGARVRRRPLVLGVLLALVLSSLLVVHAARARGDGEVCGRFAADSRARAAAVAGTGERVVVIGDSWSVGRGLAQPAASWPSRLSGRVHVTGFSGSGFSEDASPCRGVSFADRAPAALRGGAHLVVVEGGLNDFDQPAAAIRSGFRRLMVELAGHRVLVVGPAAAPARAAAVPRVDRLLAHLSARYGVPYIRTSALHLPYLDDRLHPTLQGQEEFGDYVAARVAGAADDPS